MKSKINYTNFDMYSKKIGFYFNSQEQIGSYFGLLLTVTYILVSLILFIYQIIKIIQRSELKVYDTKIYSQEMPIIDVDMNHLYFAFALEDPITSNKFIDESIYTAQIAFIDKQKINDKFETVNQKKLDFEKCNLDNFGKNYQHLFGKDELSNSYCLKNFNYSLTLAGSYKYERITYIRIRIFPCVNSTKNNFTCKSQKEIDYYMTNGYFSIVLKDFGLNPSNYLTPVLPTVKDLFTTIDKRFHKNYILSFGVTEIHTDTGIINNNINKQKYLQFRSELENFTFREEKDYYAGKSLILVQLRLDDTIVIQTRTYTKISELFSRIGGYMQIINTIFLLISSFINKLNAEIKIINKIFDFNIREKKMILKLQSLKEFKSKINLKSNKNIYIQKKPLYKNNSKIEYDNKSKNNLIIKNKNISPFNISENKNLYESQNYIIKINNNKNIMSLENSKTKSKNEKFQNEENDIKLNRKNFEKIVFDIDDKNYYNTKDYNENTNFNIIDYICMRKNSQKKKYIKLYNKANLFYKKKIDIVRVFTLLSIIEDIIKR